MSRRPNVGLSRRTGSPTCGNCHQSCNKVEFFSWGRLPSDFLSKESENNLQNSSRKPSSLLLAKKQQLDLRSSKSSAITFCSAVQTSQFDLNRWAYQKALFSASVSHLFLKINRASFPSPVNKENWNKSSPSLSRNDFGSGSRESDTFCKRLIFDWLKLHLLVFFIVLG